MTKKSPGLFGVFCTSMGLPKPQAEYVFHPTRKWAFDFAWENEKVALEVEGGVWSGGRHTSSQGFLKDMEKKNAAACLGWRILYITPQYLMSLTAIQLIKEALAIYEYQHPKHEVR